MFHLVNRISQAVAALLRRLGLTYQGNESFGKIRINGVSIKKWFQPKLNSPFRGKATDFNSFQARLGRGIIHQQRNIRTVNLSLEQEVHMYSQCKSLSNLMTGSWCVRSIMSINDLNRKLTAKNSTGKEMLMEFNVDAVNGVLRRMIKD